MCVKRIFTNYRILCKRNAWRIIRIEIISVAWGGGVLKIWKQYGSLHTRVQSVETCLWISSGQNSCKLLTVLILDFAKRLNSIQFKVRKVESFIINACDDLNHFLDVNRHIHKAHLLDLWCKWGFAISWLRPSVPKIGLDNKFAGVHLSGHAPNRRNLSDCGRALRIGIQRRSWLAQEENTLVTKKSARTEVCRAKIWGQEDDIKEGDEWSSKGWHLVSTLSKKKQKSKCFFRIICQLE